MARPKKIPIPKEEKKNAWVITYILLNQVVKMVIRCDGFDNNEGDLWMMGNDDCIAVIKNWVVIEKVSESEAQFIEEEEAASEFQTSSQIRR